MTKWKRSGVIVVKRAFDHKPEHVHVYRDGKPMLKFNTEKWCVMQGNLTAQIKKALNQLRKEGKI